MSKQKAQNNGTGKRAAIYVRVSSEQQAEKVSPDIQERDCRAYCERKGYVVVELYRDIEKYRIGKRLVEPSGTRADRPQLKRMIADADAGKFDVIIAWREDRLYRAFRPMLDVLDCLDRNELTIELSNDTFDPKFAPVKAWAAKMELEAKHERFMMGVAGRLAKGKSWNHRIRYGYKRVDSRIEIDPIESEWVKKIWNWFYVDSIGANQIRRNLIAAGAPQRYGSTNRIKWGQSSIYHVLDYDTYFTGKLLMTWGEETFEIDVPPIIPAEMQPFVIERRKRNKTIFVRHVKHNYLAAGFVYCAACNRKASVSTLTTGKRSHYKCGGYTLNLNTTSCMRNLSANKLDEELWRKVWIKITERGEFESLVEARITSLREQEFDAKEECEKLNNHLDEVTIQRQWIITQARTKKITAADMDMQLAALEIQEAGIRRELDSKRLLVGNQVERLIELLNIYRQDILRGAEGLNSIPETPEQTQKQFELRRKFVEGFVTRVDVKPDYDLKITAVFDFEELIPASQITIPSTR